MADVQKILNLVAQGALSPEDADEILTALSSTRTGEPTAGPASTDQSEHAGQAGQQASQSGRQANQGGQFTNRAGQETARHLRIQVMERGRPVVNLRVPMNIASWAANYIPGLSDQDADRIRGAIATGMAGPIIDIGDDEDRVLITSE